MSMNRKKATGMVVTKRKVFRLGLVSILILSCCVHIDAVSPEDRKTHIVP